MDLSKPKKPIRVPPLLLRRHPPSAFAANSLFTQPIQLPESTNAADAPAADANAPAPAAAGAAAAGPQQQQRKRSSAAGPPLPHPSSSSSSSSRNYAKPDTLGGHIHRRQTGAAAGGSSSSSRGTTIKGRGSSSNRCRTSGTRRVSTIAAAAAQYCNL